MMPLESSYQVIQVPEEQRTFGVPREVIETLKSDINDIKKWQRIQGLESLQRVLSQFDEEDLIIYNEADGDTTVRDIANKVTVSRNTVSRRLSEWGEMGIVEKDGRQWKHLVPLSALGMDVPVEE